MEFRCSNFGTFCSRPPKNRFPAWHGFCSLMDSRQFNGWIAGDFGRLFGRLDRWLMTGLMNGWPDKQLAGLADDTTMSWQHNNDWRSCRITKKEGSHDKD